MFLSVVSVFGVYLVLVKNLVANYKNITMF